MRATRHAMCRVDARQEILARDMCSARGSRHRTRIITLRTQKQTIWHTDIMASGISGISHYPIAHNQNGKCVHSAPQAYTKGICKLASHAEVGRSMALCGEIEHMPQKVTGWRNAWASRLGTATARRRSLRQRCDDKTRVETLGEQHCRMATNAGWTQ